MKYIIYNQIINEVVNLEELSEDWKKGDKNFKWKMLFDDEFTDLKIRKFEDKEVK